MLEGYVSSSSASTKPSNLKIARPGTSSGAELVRDYQELPQKQEDPFVLMRSSSYCERAQEALLVGRYLKENGLFKTLRCFLKETPIREVPQVDKENMLSLTEILKDFRSLLQQKEEFEEQKKRMQQYEEILNLLFEELRDVYNFRSSPANGCYIDIAAHPHSDVRSQQEDSILVEDYGLRNCGRG